MKIGKIVSVNYNQFHVKISSEVRGNTISISGTIYYFGNIGSYLKTTNAIGEELICEVISIFDRDYKDATQAFDIEGCRELILKPIGTLVSDKFSLGIGIFPSIYSDVSIVTYQDMEKILKKDSCKKKENTIHKDFYLGKSKNLINYPVHLNIDDFFNIHVAILGNSGSGKSNTIAHILQEIHKKDSHSAIGSRILVFDVNDEYKKAFEGSGTNTNIKVKCYKPNLQKEEGTENNNRPFYLPHYLFTLDEWAAFLMATDATQKPFWNRVLQESCNFYKLATAEESEHNKWINYIKLRINNSLSAILSQSTTDSIMITTAQNMLYSLIQIFEANEKIKMICDEFMLSEAVDALKDACTLNFGLNKGALQVATGVFREGIDMLACEDISTKTKQGFFDWKFLRLASEMVLLEEEAKGNKRIREHTSTMLARLDAFLENDEYSFMKDMPPDSKIQDSTEFQKDLWDFASDESNDTQMVIIDTSELPRDALEILTSVVSRMHFDSRKSLGGKKRQERPIHLVLDEAHRYIKKDTSYIIKENIFEVISREGRKYSMFLVISSQRPSELSETVLSQCGNFIIHRIQNERDMRFVNAILPFFSDDFTLKIKQSTPGEALVFGHCVPMPLHVKIMQANPEPESANCKISEEWFKDSKSNHTSKTQNVF